MRGHKSIMEARREGFKPRTIFFEIDLVQIPPDKRFKFEEPENYLQTRQFATVEMSLAGDWRTADLRFVRGCALIILASEWSDGLTDLGEMLSAKGARTITVMTSGSPEILQYNEERWKAHV